jgi:hypothetical protein
MSDNDLIRRGDAIRQADRWVRGFVEADTIGKAITALPAADPLADPRVKALVEALKHMVNHAILGEQNEDFFWEAVPLSRAALAAFKGDEA